MLSLHLILNVKKWYMGSGYTAQLCEHWGRSTLLPGISMILEEKEIASSEAMTW